MEIAFGNVGNVIIFEIENTFGMLNNSRWIRGDKVLNGLRRTIIAEECARAGATELWHGGRVVEGATGLIIIQSGFGAEFNIDEIDLELLLSLHTDNQRGSTAGTDNLVRIMDRFNDKSKCTLLLNIKQYNSVIEAYQFFDHSLDERGERDGLV